MADVPESSLNPHPPEIYPYSHSATASSYECAAPAYNASISAGDASKASISAGDASKSSIAAGDASTISISSALQPLPPPPTVASPPLENVLPRRNIPPLLRWVERWIPNNETTVMIKNIPFRYNRELMIRFLDGFCLQENEKARYSNRENIHVFAYDYLYLPLDTIMNRIKGYAFLNFTDKRTLWNFILAFSDGVKVFPGSNRRVELAIAYIQGENALRRQFQSAKYASEAIGFYPPRDGY